MAAALHSSAASPQGGSTTTRDYLYRALYLRREALILSTQHHHGSTGSSGNAAPTTAATASTGASSIDLNDILLLPPLYGVEGLAVAPHGHDGTPPCTDPMLTLDHAWRGLVHVRGAASPWYRGCFAFYVYFPSRYPFEPPIIELAGPLRSHPLVQERRVLHLDHLSSSNGADPYSEASSRVAPQSSVVSVNASANVGRRAFLPFEATYAAVDPMRVSVMAVLLQHVLRMFYPVEWPPAWEAAAASRGAGQAAAMASVNRVLARRDVERRSVTQEVVLGRPYEQYVGADVMEHFLELWDAVGRSEAADVTETVEGSGADWYTREVLPHLLHT